MSDRMKPGWVFGWGLLLIIGAWLPAYAIVVYSATDSFLVCAWVFLTFMALVGWMAHLIVAHQKPQFSLKKLLWGFTWVAIGCVLFARAEDKRLVKNYEAAVDKTLDDMSIGRSVYESAVYIAFSVPWPEPKRRMLVQGYKETLVGLTLVIEWRDRMGEVVEAADKLVLRSRIANKLRGERRLYLSLLKELAAMAVTMQAAVVEHPEKAEEYRHQIKVLFRMEEIMAKRLAQVETASFFPSGAMQALAGGHLRAAAFELQKWPGLSPEQLAAMHSCIDDEPYCAWLMLIDYGVTNAMEWGEASEDAAIAKFNQNKYLAVVLEQVPTKQP